MAHCSLKEQISFLLDGTTIVKENCNVTNIVTIDYATFGILAHFSGTVTMRGKRTVHWYVTKSVTAKKWSFQVGNDLPIFAKNLIVRAINHKFKDFVWNDAHI